MYGVHVFEDPCDSGNAKEYQSVGGISVIGATSVYQQECAREEPSGSRRTGALDVDFGYEK